MKVVVNHKTNDIEVIVSEDEFKKLAEEIYYSCETGEPLFMEGPASAKMMQDIMEGFSNVK